MLTIMKLIRFFLASALLVLAGCSKNQDLPDADGMMTINAVNSVFKTTTTDGVNVQWEKGDQIAVFVSGGVGENSQSALYETNISAPASSATFVLTNGLEPVKQDNIYLAVYPASQLYVWNTSPKKKCAMDIPAEQKVSAPGWDKRASLMAATSTTDEFVFRHCVSYVKFTVTEDSPSIVSFEVSSNEPVVSRVSVQMTDDNTATATMSTPTALQFNTVTLSMENGQAFPAGSYYVAILSKTYASGLTLTCVGADGKKFGGKTTPKNVEMTPGAVGNYGNVQRITSGSIDPLKPFDLFKKRLRVSLVGDSITTYEGPLVTNFSNSENGGAYYPTGNVTSVSDQYWHKLINKMSNAVLDVNNSLRGSMVIRRTQSNYLNVDFSARVALYGLGNPDVVIINGGTNDCTKHSESYAFRPGLYRADMLLSDSFLNNSFDAGFVDNPAYDAEPYKGMAPTNLPSDAEFNAVFTAAEAADTWDEILALEDRSFIHSYVKLLNMIHFKHPSAKVVMLIGDALTKRAQEAVLKIAAHYEQLYGYKCVNFFGLADSIGKASGAHPSSEGFTFMANKIYEEVGSYIDPQN